jgi:hypothetical protein
VTRFIVLFILIATAVLVVVGTLWPNASAIALAGTRPWLMSSSSTPKAAVESLLAEVSRRNWTAAYARLGNRSEFSEQDFVRDLNGAYPSLRSYANLASFDVSPLHISGDEAQVRANLHWSTVVGPFHEVRDLRVVRSDGQWRAVWPIVKESRVPPQVITENYLRWDIIYRGPEDDWGAQDVESPHIKIVDLHPIDRGDGVVLLGEILNQDVVPAFVTIKASLLAKDGSTIVTEDAFDKISHVLLPKQVTPFRIDFHKVHLSQVDSVHMDPSSSLIAASADPIIEIEDQRLSSQPHPTLTGQLLNQSGQIVNITHLLGTFYDNRGQVIWVSDEYANRALLPSTPLPFAMPVPADLAGKISTYRAVATPYSSTRFQ